MAQYILLCPNCMNVCWFTHFPESYLVFCLGSCVPFLVWVVFFKLYIRNKRSSVLLKDQSCYSGISNIIILVMKISPCNRKRQVNKCFKIEEFPLLFPNWSFLSFSKNTPQAEEPEILASDSGSCLVSCSLILDCPAAQGFHLYSGISECIQCIRCKRIW